MEIKGVTAVVTGGASGLGAATAERLAQAGARVLSLDRPGAEWSSASDHEALEKVEVDVTEAAAVRDALAAARDYAEPLRVVVNCAGIDRLGGVLDEQGPHEAELFRAVVEVNLVGTFIVLSEAAAVMAATEPLTDDQRGIIVNTASTLAFEGQAGQAAYAASKAAVVGLTLPVARDLAPFGIRVVSVSPGIFETAMTTRLTDDLRAAGVAQRFLTAMGAGPTSPRRYGRAEEFAKLVETLVEHDYLNAENVRLDGGLRFGSG